jgi:hypothetical protein
MFLTFRAFFVFQSRNWQMRSNEKSSLVISSINLWSIVNFKTDVQMLPKNKDSRYTPKLNGFNTLYLQNVYKKLVQ